MQQRSAAAQGEGGRRASTWAREEQVAAELSRGLPRELPVQGPNLLTMDSVFLFHSNSQAGSAERGTAGRRVGGSERQAEVLRGVCGGSKGSGGGAGEAGRGGDGAGRTLANCLEVPGDAERVWLTEPDGTGPSPQKRSGKSGLSPSKAKRTGAGAASSVSTETKRPSGGAHARAQALARLLSRGQVNAVPGLPPHWGVYAFRAAHSAPGPVAAPTHLPVSANAATPHLAACRLREGP